MKFKTLFSFVIFYSLFSVSSFAQGTDWYVPTRENKPFLRWWWLGSAVDKEGLTYNLQEFADKGIGGVEVTPIYGVMGNEANDIDFLSDKWMDIYKFLKAEGDRVGVEIDLNCGTGWPFGGPHISEGLAAHKMEIKDGQLKSVPTRQHVKRAAPGGEGLVMDHYNKEALNTYLERFDEAFSKSGAQWPDTWFNDSFEVYNSDWTAKLPETFKKRYGYDIVEKLIAGPETEDYCRALCDYRECLAWMLEENFTKPWTEWAHSHGSRVRNQSHGSPANILDLYSMVDIPECETYGGKDYDIQGLRKDPYRRNNDGDPCALKFATSAAHIMGKKYTSAETLTWMTDHFRTSLSQCKPEIDQAFAAGVNHIVFHGAPYSPKDAAFPGWLFYASINMSPTSSMWSDASGLFKYIERCQAFLSAGEPDADFYLYFPIYDVWSRFPQCPLMMFSIHNMGKFIPDFKSIVAEIQSKGFDVDYISDRLLKSKKIDKPVIVPPCKYIPLKTARRLARLQKKGVAVYFIQNCPDDVPGLSGLKARQKKFARVSRKFAEPLSLEEALSQYAGESASAAEGLTILRRRNECGGNNYFVAMLQNKNVDGWVKLGRAALSAEIFNPLDGKYGKAMVRQAEDGCAEIWLQVQAGESRLIKTFPYEIDIEDWHYSGTKLPAVVLDSEWAFSFVESEPGIATAFKMASPVYWTGLPPEECRQNSGIGCYSTTFSIEDPSAADEWLIELGEVRESARVIVNGQEAGCAWCAPFSLAIGKMLHSGENSVEIQVSNLYINRIAQMDREGIRWRIFKNANVEELPGFTGELDYTKRPVEAAGICGPIVLTPVKYIQ